MIIFSARTREREYKSRACRNIRSCICNTNTRTLLFSYGLYWIHHLISNNRQPSNLLLTFDVVDFFPYMRAIKMILHVKIGVTHDAKLTYATILLWLLLTRNEFSFCSFQRSIGSIVQPHELYQFTNKQQHSRIRRWIETWKRNTCGNWCQNWIKY